MIVPTAPLVYRKILRCITRHQTHNRTGRIGPQRTGLPFIVADGSSTRAQYASSLTKNARLPERWARYKDSMLHRPNKSTPFVLHPVRAAHCGARYQPLTCNRPADKRLAPSPIWSQLSPESNILQCVAQCFPRLRVTFAGPLTYVVLYL